MNKFRCPYCKKEAKLALVPDYSSSGIQCANCGIVFMVNENVPLIPKGLFSLIDSWVFLWDMCSSYPENLRLEKVYSEFVEAGIELCRQVNEYYPCMYDENLWKFNIDESE